MKGLGRGEPKDGQIRLQRRKVALLSDRRNSLKNQGNEQIGKQLGDDGLDYHLQNKEFHFSIFSSHRRRLDYALRLKLLVTNCNRFDLAQKRFV